MVCLLLLIATGYSRTAPDSSTAVLQPWASEATRARGEFCQRFETYLLDRLLPPS